MAQHSWVNDGPSGVYKNHDLSSRIRMASIAEAKFMRFVKAEEGFGKWERKISIEAGGNITVDATLKKKQ